MSLAIVPAVNSCGDVAYLLQCRFYLHKVVDVELHGIAVLLPHLAGYEDGIMRRPLGLFQSGLRSSTVYSPSCGGGTVPAPFFAGKFFFAYHVTVAFARNEKRVSVAYVTRTRAYDGRYEKGRQSHTFSGLPAVLLPFRAGFSYSVALMPPFCFRRQPFRQAVPPPFQPCRSWSFSRLAFRGWRGSGRNPWRCG